MNVELSIHTDRRPACPRRATRRTSVWKTTWQRVLQLRSPNRFATNRKTYTRRKMCLTGMTLSPRQSSLLCDLLWWANFCSVHDHSIRRVRDVPHRSFVPPICATLKTLCFSTSHSIFLHRRAVNLRILARRYGNMGHMISLVLSYFSAYPSPDFCPAATLLENIDMQHDSRKGPQSEGTRPADFYENTHDPEQQ
jgi:hypothetical protein